MTYEILGRSCMVPSAGDADQLFELLRQGICAVSTIPDERWSKARFWHPARGMPGKAYTFAAGILAGVYDFDPAVFGISAREASYMDPQQRILLQAVWRALEDASISQAELQRERVGVYIGASSLDNGNLQIEDPASGGPHFMTGNTLSIISNRISHSLGLNGPSMTIDTACSSSLVALHQAERALRDDEIDTAIVGGVNLLLHPFSFIGFSQARMLSPEGLCRAYSDNGEGYVRAEGAGAVVLRRTDRALRDGSRSRATLVASGMNSAGRTNGISLPSREAQAQLLRSVYSDNEIDPDQLAFIEGHGTGTKVGDPAELWAIGSVLGRVRSQPLLIGSIKSNIGHAEPASGILGLIKAVLSLENNYLPASLHAERLNQNIDFNDLNVEVNRAGRALDRGTERRMVGVNSFGFGGTNVHVVISDAPSVAEASVADEGGMFILSAHTQSALHTLLEEYDARFAPSSTAEKANIISATRNRSLLKHRFVTAGKSAEDISSAVSSYLDEGHDTDFQVGEVPGKAVKTAFVYAGNGSQWVGMGIDAYRESGEFKTRFDHFSQLFSVRAGIDIAALLFAGDLDQRLRDTRIAQPLLFAVQAALTDCLVSYGVKPDIVFGHSVGEVAAAYAAGILSAEDATTIVSIRSKHQHALAGMGTMAAVVMSEPAAVAFAQRHGLDNIKVAATNAHNSVTISGPVDEIKGFKVAAQATRNSVHILDINYPFHHPAIDGERAAFLEEIPLLTPQSGHVTFISTVTGAEIDGEELDANYWWRNVREPIAFETAVNVALEAGCNLFLEISPRPILSTYVTETAKQRSASAVVLPTLARPGLGNGVDPVKRSALRGISHGAKVADTSGRSRGMSGIDLPPLPFETATYRPNMTSDAINVFGRDGADGPYTLLGWRTDPNASVWKNHIDALLFPDLAGHVVDGKSIMPGSAFIEIAVQAARAYYGTPEVEITNLEIFRPLELRDNRMAELSTRISPETGVIEIASREYMSDDGWTIHVTARSRRSVGLSRKTELNVVPLGKPQAISAVQAYETARSFGLDYAPCFQLLERAEVFGDRHIVVNLRRAASPVHPYLSYGMDPVSTDAAFHGLVALFGTLTGEIDGAPYIPVRFGAVRTASSGQPIVSAVIQIQRFSANSLKARIELLAEDGTLVAALDDCRFRRTWLRQHSTLDTVAFHYEAVARQQISSDTPSQAVAALPASLFAKATKAQADEATLLLDAAVQRACHDIALLIAGKDQTVFLSSLPGDTEFQCFLSSGLYTLEDAGIAQFVDTGWTIQPESGLPPLSDLLNEIYRRSPERVSETVLINNAYRETLKRLAKGSHSESDQSSSFLSDATLDHVRHHTALGRRREQLVIDAVNAALMDVFPGDGVTIVEAGAVSMAFSNRLADVCALKGARLVIVEPSDHLRRTLEIGFERNPSVDCLAPDDVSQLDRADVVVSASGSLYGHFRQHSGLKDVLRAAASSAGRVAIAETSSSALSDFVFGLTGTWFSGSTTAEFPTGLLASATQWEDLLKECGFGTPAVEQSDFAEGGLLLVQAATFTKAVTGHVGASSFASVFEVTQSEADSPVLSGGFSKSLLCSPDDARAAFDQLFAERLSYPLAVIFALPAGSSHSAGLQDAILSLSAFAEAARANLRAQSSARVRLVVVAAGGSPAASDQVDPNASGLWTFARVLQNEYEELDIFLLDAALSQVQTSNAVMSLLAYSGPEREWVCSARTGLLSVVRAVPGYVSDAARKTTTFEAATIQQQVSGRVDSIVWTQDKVPVPGADEIVVKVAATGLNFRDVMWSMGLLPEEALEDGFAGATIGMEMAGTVAAVGLAVTDLSIGDNVMGIGPKAFSTHMVVARDGVTKVPHGIDLAAAATVPVAFLTAYYAMVELGRIREGETILIHGAAGGVGLAALQIAKLKGAKVIATAGTVEKRRFLTLLGADHVFDSRSLAFVGDVLRVTDGEGVELVLNSLFAEAMERSFELVKPFGRFLELGKRDYYSDRKLALRPFRRNISYFGIDADQLLVKAPDLTRRIFADIGTLFLERKLTPLPYRAFNYDETGAAFRLMQNAGHIGKIVVHPPVHGQDHVQVFSHEPLKLSSGVYLVVGGIGGFGLETAKWLVSRGATHIALSTRGGVADTETLDAIAAWKASGIKTTVHACDVTVEASLQSLLTELRSYGPVKGVVHAAMVLNDGLISNLDREKNRAVIDVKALGASNLDRLTRSDELELFLLFSSATTMIGNPGQGNYVAANGYLEGLARERRGAGLPALAIGFGAIGDTGFLARNSNVSDILSRRLGKKALKARGALGFVERVIVNDTGAVDQAAVMIAELDWSSAAALPITAQPLFSAIPRNAAGGSPGVDGEQIDLAALVAGKSNDEAHAILHGFLAGEIAAILKVAEDSVKADKVLKDIGLDSLMAMELGVGFQQKTGIDIPLSGMGDGATVGDIVQKLYEKVTANDNSDDADDAVNGTSLVEQLTDKHTATVSERKIGHNG
ncbi:type I polyketide synthase [Agrobacterium rosae]|uniref:Type I polyketide synthase n=1 Tax=Agrobacterium rosae TaxID=1972867 RepID=A0AAW9FJV3_9HYPH|nr:type I polyketide synthase [Agrobacterium rosae]MDX8305775.1 type I polyketide synthase [Agrobacterium rosae]